MECDAGDFSNLEVVNTGFADPLALLDEGQTDLAWIFFAWQGVQAELLGIELNVVMMEDWFECVPDYYTPVIITNEAMLAANPEVVRSFLSALSKGLEFAGMTRVIYPILHTKDLLGANLVVFVLGLLVSLYPASSRPPTILSMVVLPDPDGPAMATKLPLLMDNVIPLRAGISTFP